MSDEIMHYTFKMMNDVQNAQSKVKAVYLGIGGAL